MAPVQTPGNAVAMANPALSLARLRRCPVWACSWCWRDPAHPARQPGSQARPDAERQPAARLARQHWQTNPARAAELLGQLGADLDQVATDLRHLAHGIYPPALADLGLPAALTAAAARCPRPVAIHADSTARYPPAVEAAIYLCCLEALQNAAKHAGDHARITVTLRHETTELVCEISDDGTGLTGTRAGAGAGLTNMADRIAAVGGQLRIDSAPGRSTTVRAAAPTLRPHDPAPTINRECKPTRPPAHSYRHHHEPSGLHPAVCRLTGARSVQGTRTLSASCWH